MFRELFTAANYHFNIYALPVIIVGLSIIFIGAFVLKQNRKSLINLAFFLQCSSVGLWILTISCVYSSVSQNIALLWYRYFTFLGVINIMPSFAALAFVWIGKAKTSRGMILANYCIAFLFYVLAISTDKVINPYQMHSYSWGFYPIYEKAALIFIALYLFQFSAGIVILHAAYKKETILIRKRQTKALLIATLIASVASLDFIPKFLTVDFYPFGYIAIFVYVVIVAHSIVRYKAFDIETAIHKTAMWLFSFSFIIIPVLLLYKWMLPTLRESNPLQTTFWLISSFILTLYLRIVQPKVDHFFQRRSSNLVEITSRFTEDLVHLKGLPQLIQRIEETISDTLYPQHMAIYIHDNQTERLKAAGGHRTADAAVPHMDAIAPWLILNNKIAYKEFIDIDPLYAPVKVPLNNYFEQTNTILLIPLVLNERLLGIVALGPKASFKRYTADEFQFLSALKSQSTIAISNSLLYENIEEQVRQRTKELLEVQKQLIQAEKLATVGTLAGGVAHEINNPLTAILTNVQMLLLDAKDSPAVIDREALELIEEATKRCRTIVQKLMTYAKKPLENAEIKEVDLMAVLKNVNAFIGYQLAQENFTMKVDSAGSHYAVMGNQNELEQVVTNLVLNARDASRPVKKNGTIYVSLYSHDNCVDISVRDEGVGIPPEIRTKIFDPFFTTKEVGKGTGLGLSICQSIMEKHNGSITLQSEIGKGSVFTMHLPKNVGRERAK